MLELLKSIRDSYLAMPRHERRWLAATLITLATLIAVAAMR